MEKMRGEVVGAGTGGGAGGGGGVWEDLVAAGLAGEGGDSDAEVLGALRAALERHDALHLRAGQAASSGARALAARSAFWAVWRGRRCGRVEEEDVDADGKWMDSRGAQVGSETCGLRGRGGVMRRVPGVRLRCAG
jgi:hypothetical protein